MKNRLITFVVAILGIIFLVAPMSLNTVSQHLQNQVYTYAQKSVISCRAEIAMKLFDQSTLYRSSIEKNLDSSCGKVPDYNDFQPESTNGVLSFYNWIGQKITFIPL